MEIRRISTALIASQPLMFGPFKMDTFILLFKNYKMTPLIFNSEKVEIPNIRNMYG
jgi:hypothetical protein